MGMAVAMTSFSKVTAKGQTTIPIEIRDRLGVKPGDSVGYEIAGGEVRLVRRRSALEFAGVLGNPTRPAASVEDMNAAIDDALNERHERGLDRG
jgi:AbrB family looped-hinge helix DNA binding protein